MKKCFSFPVKEIDIPRNGINVIFEMGETINFIDKIVSKGNHKGEKQLCLRLKQLFVN